MHFTDGHSILGADRLSEAQALTRFSGTTDGIYAQDPSIVTCEDLQLFSEAYTVASRPCDERLGTL